MQTTINDSTVNVTEKLYDLCMVEKLCRGKQDQIMQMVKVFMAQVPKAVEEIRIAYQQGDYAQVKSTTHRIKPVLSFYAVVKVEKDMPQIEQLADENRPSAELAQKIQKLEVIVATIMEQMKADFFITQ